MVNVQMYSESTNESTVIVQLLLQTYFFCVLQT